MNFHIHDSLANAMNGSCRFMYKGYVINLAKKDDSEVINILSCPDEAPEILFFCTDIQDAISKVDLLTHNSCSRAIN